MDYITEHLELFEQLEQQRKFLTNYSQTLENIDQFRQDLEELNSTINSIYDSRIRVQHSLSEIEIIDLGTLTNLDINFIIPNIKADFEYYQEIISQNHNFIKKLNQTFKDLISIPGIKDISLETISFLEELETPLTINSPDEIDMIFRDEFIDKFNQEIQNFKEEKKNTAVTDKPASITIKRSPEKTRQIIDIILSEVDLTAYLVDGLYELVFNLESIVQQVISKATNSINSQEIRTITLGIVATLITRFIIYVISFFFKPLVEECFEDIRSSMYDFLGKKDTLEKYKSNLQRNQHKINDYKFISSDYAILKERKSLESEKVKKLEFGSAIKVLYKEDNWLLVEWLDEDKQKVVAGWVLNRLTSKLK
ncbi:hypothetical protein [Fuchsiella alkaliacetigena]|uniref:hypothetical protein n=1 Tax=Fuchsiella alkaliacetigena TaxID=957042 RepID=UPI00200A1B74|nr:hypothetical protein [Fuchsiella alkaliacetigena]MCK8824677.1 hypothetical protein [Fuchsiella alkaliacetigena]